jgi:hypothetical protein
MKLATITLLLVAAGASQASAMNCAPSFRRWISVQSGPRRSPGRLLQCPAGTWKQLRHRPAGFQRVLTAPLLGRRRAAAKPPATSALADSPLALRSFRQGGCVRRCNSDDEDTRVVEANSSDGFDHKRATVSHEDDLARIGDPSAYLSSRNGISCPTDQKRDTEKGLRTRLRDFGHKTDVRLFFGCTRIFGTRQSA